MGNRLRSFFLILNLKTLIIASLAVVSTYLCCTFGLVADFPLTLIATAVVFPIVFSIRGACKRSETALHEYSSNKTHGISIYFAAREWLEGATPENPDKAKALLGDLLKSCRKRFAEPLDAMPENEKSNYGQFSKLSKFIKHDLRGAGLASGEVSLCNQYLSKMMVAFESIKHICHYRTPGTLRSCKEVLIAVLPPLYGPCFVHVAQDYS